MPLAAEERAVLAGFLARQFRSLGLQKVQVQDKLLEYLVGEGVAFNDLALGVPNDAVEAAD